MRYWYQRD